VSSYTIVGVVGHIDHGKTALVKALTGTDTDTHPEEKQRGITIDLGFASYQTGDGEFALIDAPGHHKYLGNLLAGVSSVDVGLLVVAADQGIQAQTIEHTAILNALGVPKLIVVMSRIDLCQRETLPELEEELCVFLSDYGFADFPVLSLSVRTGEGLGELKQELSQMARQEERNHHGSFRLPVDRVFSVEGRGCVVAGTIGSGSVSVGDSLQVVGGPTVRVRELEVHSQPVESSRAGRRTAINLAGVTAKELRRGDELIASEAFEPLRHFLMEVTLFPDAQEVPSPAQAQIHTGTSSCSARLSSSKAFLAEKPVVALVETERSIIGVYDQKCLFRRPDPIGAFAGGRINRTSDGRIPCAGSCSSAKNCKPPRQRSGLQLGLLFLAKLPFRKPGGPRNSDSQPRSSMLLSPRPCKVIRFSNWGNPAWCRGDS